MLWRKQTMLRLLMGVVLALACTMGANAGPPANGAAHGLVLLHQIYGDWSGMPVQDNPHFGFSVAMDGYWLAVGAPFSIVDGGVYGVMRHGAVFLFHREGGIWQLKERIIKPQYGNSFCGASVAMDLPLLIFGCESADNSNPSTNAGAVYWYRLDGEDWNLEHSWNGVISGYCGYSVDISEGTGVGTALAAYGCPGWNNGQGLVRVWEYTPEDGWAFDGTLFASDGSADDRFGRSVSVSVETGVPSGYQRIAVGAPLKNLASALDGGKVYLFDRNLAWTNVDSMTLYEPLGDDFAFFGSAVAIRGDDLLIGSTNVDAPDCPATGQGCGAAQRYSLVSGDWSLQNTAWVESNANIGGNPPGPQEGMSFGSALSFGFDGMVAIGAPWTDGFTWNGGLAEDVGLVELRSASNLHVRLGEVRPSLGIAGLSGGRFGTSIDFGDEYMAIGYPRSGLLTINGAERYGSVYLYRRDRIFADGFENE